ncbi:MAG: polysaccharide pyruvyl transferase family protein [Streptosporangiaceae bacterium]
MRILVDQSGYDLLNIGDVAMLQSCVTRLRGQWPAAEIMVIATAPERLAAYCPGTIAISRTFADLPGFRLVPRKARLALEQAWKIAGPYLARQHGRPLPGRPRTAVQAVRAADLVVASGGGYVTDTWWWHASGVLSLLSLAQRLGKPTAMFGQGIGPMKRRLLRAQSRAVLPRLTLLSLREERTGGPLASSLGVAPTALKLTGDDALEQGSHRGALASPGALVSPGALGADSAAGHALGVNLRVSGYAGVDQATAASVASVVRAVAAELRADLVGLPVSRYATADDAGALRELWPAQPRPGQPRAGESPGAGLAVDDITTPEGLVTAVAQCRAVITGSYHAALFSLAAGVPAVCLTKSPYYDAKFGGLAALFPGACRTVSLGGPQAAARLRVAVQEAWQLPPAARAAAAATAAGLRDAGRQAYAQFRLAVESHGSPAERPVMLR